MAATRKDLESESPRRPPARSPEARENQLIEAAVDLVEKRLRDGSASAQETIHYLKLASTSRKIQEQREQLEIQLLEARAENLRAVAQQEQIAKAAIEAMRSYGGAVFAPDPDEYDDY
jgi:hypothetical protein